MAEIRKPTHETFARLSDEDLLLAMDAIRRELRNPTPRGQSLSMFDRPYDPGALIQQLSCLQHELDWRIHLETKEG